MLAPPPFPDDVPTAIFDTIVLQKLIEGDELEEQRLFYACKHEGFFYLDFRNVTTNQIEGQTSKFADHFTDIVRQTFDICMEVQNWPIERKIKYEKTDRVFGYVTPNIKYALKFLLLNFLSTLLNNMIFLRSCASVTKDQGKQE